MAVAIGKVLIVDDDSDIRLALSARLQASGYAIAFAADGIEATRTAREQRPDVILLDLGVPAGDGYVIMERLQQYAETATIPVIVLTARDAAKEEEKALEAGAVRFFSKPIDHESLLDAIDRCTVSR